jgi:alkylation response protein AidB-like acyl-CoA dehydrogenase
MNFSLTDEQGFLREAAVNALSRIDTVAGARGALDGEPLPELWPTAREAGWTGLLVPEADGGAGLEAFDAMLVLEQCGRRLAGAGLIGHLAATLVLSRTEAEELLTELADGARRAAIVLARPPAADEGWTVEAIGGGRASAPTLSADGRLTGAAGFQLDLGGSDVLLVAAIDANCEPCVALVDPSAAEIEPVTRCDASRPLAHVRFYGVPARRLRAGADALTEAWYVAQALLAADALGVAEAMLELSVSYAKDRHAFGRPIGSYQAIKQQIVEILRHAGTTRSLCFYAGYAAQARPQELALAASAARFAAEEAADYATRTCIAVHGGIGATWEHDGHLYWRRAQLSRLLLGGIGDAGDRVAEEIIERARVTAAAKTN